ncbi:MAG TPA: hypothetical protein PK054_06245 [Anaerohalosphaeraceae bacterium]|nr:hypothetical protein [Anaerohalosphaeraceae bacterium]HOL87591.1 hypothetical protein [Anaerohalosphaeraceae bacterium]HPP56169.1 hypothetical protein [Anaerohalosphaeraceae bacterium]
MKRTLFLFPLFLLTASVCFSGDFYWAEPIDGEMGQPDNWNPPAVPGADDSVYFTLPSAYTVWFESDYIHDRMTVDGSDLTLQLNGHTYLLDGTADYNRTVLLADTQSSALRIGGGGVFSGDLLIGDNDPQTVGALHLSGPDTFWSGYRTDGWHGFFYGVLGSAQVSVTEGAVLEHGHGQSGIDGKADFLIDGQDTEWYVDGYFGMSIYGDTLVTLSNGARMDFGYLEMARHARSSAVIDIVGTAHQTELIIENYWWDPISLNLGMGGSAQINLTGSKLLHLGHTAIALFPGSCGELNITDGSWADLQGSVAVGGTLDKPGGRGLISLSADPDKGLYAELSAANHQAGEQITVWPEGVIRMEEGQISAEYSPGQANPIVLKGGTLEGWGWIRADVVNESGIVMPGVSGMWKFLDIIYNYYQGSNGTLKIGIGGLHSAWGHSILTAQAQEGGQVVLDGYLDVDLLDGYVPNYEDSFAIIEARHINGRFLNAVSEVIFEEGTFDILYQTDRVVLTHFRSDPRCPSYPNADFNRDCRVDMNDLAVLAGQWLECRYEPGDFCP